MVIEICQLFKIRKSSFKVNLKTLVPDKKMEHKKRMEKPLQREILFTLMLLELKKKQNRNKGIEKCNFEN